MFGADILGNHIVGPFFISNNLDCESYLHILKNFVDTHITHLLEDGDELVFQKIRALPHYDAPVRNFLNNHFSEWRTGSWGTIKWPPRSPAPTPLDFFLWRHLKSKVYVT